jgi:hypothetical protein
MQKICFFNYYHNGDVFSAKGWIQMLREQLPDHKMYYAHLESPRVMLDLNFDAFEASWVPEHIRNTRIGVHNDVIYINTWVGMYVDELFQPGQHHGNWFSFWQMWHLIFQELQKLGVPVTFTSDPLDGVPITDWSYYDTAPADAFVKKYSRSRIHLFGNGAVRSGQSGLTDLKPLLEELSRRFPTEVFVATSRFPTRRSNIHFTDDIFGISNDINEIAYLSTHCDTVVGKNGGPFLFCHVRQNVFDPAKTFVALTQRVSDSYPWRTTGYQFGFLHSTCEDQSELITRFTQLLTQTARGSIQTL